MPFQPGQRVGDYEVVKLLGAGGMGHVYRVRNIISNRSEAMKVLLPDLTAEPELAMRFISEIRTLAGFDHPNIAQLHTALQADNQLIMIMEFVEGYTLEEIARQRKMSVQEVSGFISQALSALGYAHEHGVIHRDIKPANLMVTSHGVLKLMDFGIAKSNSENHAQTKPGTTMGSLYYMSPEQVRGTGVDARADIYSVGIVLYELLAGRRPFEADTTFSILNQQINTPPQPPIEVNPSLPRGLNDVILRALEKDPAQRFQTAEEFRTALKPFINAPSGHEVMAPITQPMPTPASAQAPLTAQQPSFQPVPPPSMAQPGYPGPPAYPGPRGPQYGAPMPPPRRSGGKGLWIATGAIAGVLALVGVAFAVPHFLHTRAASESPAAFASTPADATLNSTPVTVPTTQTPARGTLAPDNSSPPATTASMNSPTSAASPSASPRSHAQVTPQGGHLVAPPSNSPAPTAAAAPAPATSTAEVEQAEERLMQTTARANSAKRGVAQIRSQQEASGLGLRGDIESAEERMDGYLHAANNNVGRGDAAGATRNLDKAEAELSTLEKFLGH